MILPNSVTVDPDLTQIFFIEIVSISYFTAPPYIHKGFPIRFWRGGWGEGGGLWHDPPIPSYCADLPYTHTQPLGSTVISSRYSSNFNGRLCHMPRFFFVPLGPGLKSNTKASDQSRTLNLLYNHHHHHPPPPTHPPTVNFSKGSRLRMGRM